MGNHVHRCLKVYKSLSSARNIDTVVDKAEEIAPTLTSTAKEIRRMFTRAFTLFAARTTVVQNVLSISGLVYLLQCQYFSILWHTTG